MPKTKSRRRIGLGRCILLLLWPVAGIALLLASISEAFAERVFARGVYPLYHRLLSLLPGWLPFSLGEILLYALCLSVPIVLIVWLLHIIIRKGQRWRILCSGVLNALCALGLIFAMFVFGCGINYYRTPYAEAAGLEVTESTQEELYGLCLELARNAAALRENLTAYEDSNGVFALPHAYDAAAQQAMTSLGEQEDMLRFSYPRPKPVLLSRGMSYLGIVGIYSPFTGEANFNTDTVDYTIPATMCHELCHTTGIMREDEANYLAYLACTRHGDDVLAYSGTMLALVYSVNALHRVSPALYAQVYDCFSEGMLRDFRASSAYWAQFEDSAASEISEQMNDAYLKANNQPTGTQSYGAMVDLLLAEYKAGMELKTN